MGKKVIFLSGLNGIRAIAACGVMFSHVNLALSKFGMGEFSLFGFTKDGKAKSWVLGEHGVTMFFVLSGFLITYLLLKEFEKTNRIDIRKFYIRRLLRIWPLYFLYLILCLFFLRDSLHLDYNIVYYSTFLANIPFVLKQSYTGMEHLWSISIEEQFYLFWPFLFLLFIRDRFLVKVFYFIAILSLLRIILWVAFPFSTIALFSLVNRFDCMAFGALGAYLVNGKYRLAEVVNQKVVQCIAWAILFSLILDKFHFINSILEIFIIETVILIIIIGQIGIANRVINLEKGIFSYLGKLSFGLYVYHPLVIIMAYRYLNFDFFGTIYLNVLAVFLFVIFTTIIISHLSYTYFEKWFLNLKHNFSVIESSNSKSNV